MCRSWPAKLAVLLCEEQSFLEEETYDRRDYTASGESQDEASPPGSIQHGDKYFNRNRSDSFFVAHISPILKRYESRPL
jgi:hypothetical protein